MSDLIKREDEMGAVQDHFNANGFKGYDDGQKMMDRIKALPSAEAVSRKDILGYIDRVARSGLGKSKSIDYIRKYVERTESAEAVQNMRAWNGLYIKVYADDDSQDKAEKLYQICDSNEALSEVAKCIQGYLDEPSAEAVQGWIPVSKSLPQINTSVITCDADGYIHLDYIIKMRDSSLEFCQNACYGDCDVIAWMPLPKPYKGGEDNDT